MSANVSERDAFVRRALAARFLAEQTIAEVSHVPVGLVAVAIAFGSVAHTGLFGWFSLLVVATIARGWTRRRVAKRGPSERIPGSLRAAIAAVAIVWGVGAVAAAASLPPLHVSILLIIVCGLAAAATSTLLGDSATYAAYTASLLGLTALGTLRLAGTREFAFAVLLIVLYGAVMSSLYRRLTRIVVQSLIAEFELGESRESADRERRFLDQVFASAPNTLIVIDRDLRVVRMNPAFEQMFGYTAAEAIGQKLDALIVPDEQVAAAKELRALVQLGSVVRGDLPRRRKDGSEIIVRVSAAYISGATGGMLVIYDDISEMKQAERALRESEGRLFQTLASLPVGIMVIEPDGTPYFTNDAAVRILGRQPVADRDPNTLAENYQAYLTGTNTLYPVDRMPLVRALHGESASVDDMEVRRPDGTINLEVIGSPIRDSSGAVMFGVAAFTDITERRRAAVAIHAARVAAEEATAAKSAFLANMSHEIRTPLNGILGLAELLLDSNMSTEERRSVGLIISSGETLLHVINDILDFSKIEAHQLDIEQTDVDLASIVESTARLLMTKAAAQGIDVITDIADNIPPNMIGDPTRLRQVLTNLVGNAVKFTARGEVVVKLETVENTGERPGVLRVQFSVSDTGTGIPADKLDTIFEAFHQADATTTRRYGGTGLGLSISKRLVELMGGTIGVESTLGVGTVFHFEVSLPVGEPLHDAAHLPVSPPGTRVLIVDDSTTNRRVIRGMLEHAGCEVDEVNGGADALRRTLAARADNRPYDLVVTDLMMPDFNGFDLVRAFRNDPALADTKVIMATSASQRGDAQLCRELRVAAYLLKPLARFELLQAVGTAVGTPIRSGRRGTPARGIESVPPRLRRILLAEDNHVNQEVATAMLRRRGHTVDVVDTGRAAVDAAVATAYDVILMDLQMPDMDGIQATGEIRRRVVTRRPIIVALTASAMTGERERCLAAGMDRYVSKPFKGVDLFAAVEGDDPGAESAETIPVARSTVDQPVDLATLRDELEAGDIGDIFDTILDLFLSDSPKRMDALRASVVAGDPRPIEEAAHALKSAAGTIRAMSLTALLEEMEKAGRDGEIGNAAAQLAAIQTAYDAVNEQLANRAGKR
ncbi:MAG: response regulator [bacterium]